MTNWIRRLANGLRDGVSAEFFCRHAGKKHVWRMLEIMRHHRLIHFDALSNRVRLGRGGFSSGGLVDHSADAYAYGLASRAAADRMARYSFNGPVNEIREGEQIPVVLVRRYVGEDVFDAETIRNAVARLNEPPARCYPFMPMFGQPIWNHEEAIAARMRCYDRMREARLSEDISLDLFEGHCRYGWKHPEDAYLPLSAWDSTP